MRLVYTIYIIHATILTNMIGLAILFIIIISVLVIFAFPQFSPIPYFPSNPHDLPLIVKALKIKKNQVIFDFGAGDGIIIFEAAREAFRLHINTKFVAIEMNPILAFILHMRRLMHPNKKNIKIVCRDMFKVDYTQFASNDTSITVYIYVSPRFIPTIVKSVQKQFKHFELVSYYYPIEKNSSPESKGRHDVYRKSY